MSDTKEIKDLIKEQKKLNQETRELLENMKEERKKMRKMVKTFSRCNWAYAEVNYERPQPFNK